MSALSSWCEEVWQLKASLLLCAEFNILLYIPLKDSYVTMMKCEVTPVSASVTQSSGLMADLNCAVSYLLTALGLTVDSICKCMCYLRFKNWLVGDSIRNGYKRDILEEAWPFRSKNWAENHSINVEWLKCLFLLTFYTMSQLFWNKSHSLFCQKTNCKFHYQTSLKIP